MPMPTTGIHHVTAIGGSARANVLFYRDVLGMRLVKRTINFDDPGTWHLYYGNAFAEPGSILTFFPWGSNAAHGRRGTGQVATTLLSVPPGSLGFWRSRLTEALSAPGSGGSVTSREDPLDGASLELIAPDSLTYRIVEREDRRTPWTTDEIPMEHAVRGFAGAELHLAGYEKTAAVLRDLLGYSDATEAGSRFRFQTSAEGAGPAATLDLVCLPTGRSGMMGAGANHHIAFRARDDNHQAELREAILTAGHDVTPVLDRNYFRSIYFREPGGVLFEIATDPPGFAVDEPMDELGTALKLPSWFERHRDRIERALPALPD